MVGIKAGTYLATECPRDITSQGEFELTAAHNQFDARRLPEGMPCV
jgi:hypothetical protein